MQYINPIEILELSNITDSRSIDSNTIKKAKRRLFADIDLSDDGSYNYCGVKLTKGECEKAIEELADNDLKEIYIYLASNNSLNQFLISGNGKHLHNFTQDSIYRLPDFVKFISPYFAPKFDKALLIAFKNNDVEELKYILNTSFLISQKDINQGFKGVSNDLQNKITKVSDLRIEINNEESDYNQDSIEEVTGIIINYFPDKIINCLPSYFSSQILKIANEVNYLNAVVWEKFDNAQVSSDLLEHILKLNIDGLNKPTFEKNYEIIKRRNLQRIEYRKNEPVYRKYSDYLSEYKNKLKQIEKRSISASDLIKWVTSQIKVSEINELPEVYEEIKNQVGH